MNKIRAFSLIELSVVILIIGILVLGITQGSRIIKASKLSSARALTKNSPVSSIPNLVYWFEPTSENSFKNQSGSSAIQNNDTVSSWVDINPFSQKEFSVTQSTVGNQPRYIESGINGLPTVRFDVTNDNMMLNATGAMGGYNLDITFFVVYKFYEAHPSVNSCVVCIGGPNAEHLLVVNRADYRTISTFFSGSVQDQQESAVNYTSKGKTYLATKYLDTTRSVSNLVINGATIPNAVSAITVKGQFTQGAPGGITIGNHSGAPRTLGGDISEIIIYDRSLKNNEIASVENYLKQKYNLRY